MRCMSMLFLFILLVSGCGKKGALIYPDLLVPAAPTHLSVGQFGPGMKIAFKLPDKDKAGQSLSDLAGVKVFRREMFAAQDTGCSSCANDFKLFKAMYVDHIDASVRLYGRLFVLLDSDVKPDMEYAYKVLVFTRGNVDGESSIPVSVSMVQIPPPPVLQAVSAPTEVKLEFAGLSPLEGGLAGYNLYRWVKGESLPLIALNKEPLVINSFTDTGLERGVLYIYAVRMVVRLPKGEMVESMLSNEVEAGLRDDE